MTSAESLWREMRARRVAVSIDELGRLAFDTPDGVLPGDAIERIKHHRDELLAMLKSNAGKERPVADLSPCQQDGSARVAAAGGWWTITAGADAGIAAGKRGYLLADPLFERTALGSTSRNGSLSRLESPDNPGEDYPPLGGEVLAEAVAESPVLRCDGLCQIGPVAYCGFDLRSYRRDRPGALLDGRG
jgi:hypothetical protein